MLDEYHEFVKKQEEHISKEVLVTKRKVDEDANTLQNNEQKKIKPLDPETNEVPAKASDDSDTKKIVTMHAKYMKSKFDKRDTPKSILHSHTHKMDFARPVYRTEEKLPQRIFKSAVEVNNVIYTTPYW